MAALEVVVRTLEGEYLAPTLRAVLDAGDLEGVQRSQVTDLAYGTVRRLLQLDGILAPRLDRPDKLPVRVLTALRLGVLDLVYRRTPAHAAVDQWVEVVKGEAKGLAPLANAVLRGVERSIVPSDGVGDPLTGFDPLPQPEPRPPLDHLPPLDPVSGLSLPPWLWSRLEAALGRDAAERAALGMLVPEPLWLTAFSPSARSALEADGCEVAEHLPGARYPASLRVRAPLPLDRLSAYRDGLVQPQNPASLHAALALGVGPGERCFDLASGRGIKSAVLASGGAAVTAVELSKRRSRAAERNLERLGLDATHVTADLVTTSVSELLTAIAAANGRPAPTLAEAVLLDAPCSGTGTLRGHPEIKLRLTETDVSTLATMQAAMLRTASGLVAPGGTLVYAVCALTEDEGPRIVEEFLATAPTFTAEPITTPLPHVPASSAGVFTLPVAGLDGFYLARLRRSAGTTD